MAESKKSIQRLRDNVDDQTKQTIEYIMLVLEACSPNFWSTQKTELETALILKDVKALKKIIQDILKVEIS